MGMVEEFVSLLHKEHKSSFHEHLAMALLTLVEDNSRARSECRRPEFNFRELLEQRKILLTGREECQVSILPFESSAFVYLSSGYLNSDETFSSSSCFVWLLRTFQKK